MTTETSTSPASKISLYAGWVLTILPSLMLLMSAVMKLTNAAPVVEGFQKFGFDPAILPIIGVVELVCLILYLVPQTAVLGAILLTGYLGGATATHVRIGDNNFFAVLLGMILWGGLFLRDPRVRALIPIRW